MYSGRCAALLLFILVQADGYILDNVKCTYNFKQTCLEEVNNYEVIGYNPPVINYCTAEDVPHDIKFVVNKSGSLNIMFAPPKRECGFGVALLVNPLIKNERECEEYKFEVNDINSKVHTIERALCILRDTNQLVRYNNSLCEDNIGLWFEYIFTGCYALQFHIGRQRYVIRDQVFLDTTYQFTKVTEPQFICKYDTYSNLDQRHKITNFTLDTSLPIDTGYLLEVMLISPQNKSQGRGCVWSGGPHIGTWKINLLVTSLKEVLDNGNCSVKSLRTVSGDMKTLQCNFQVPTTQTADYCFIFRVIDDRCHENTIWNPLHINTTPCTWIKRCTNTSLHNDSIEMIKSDKLPSANLYLLLRIFATILIVLAIVVILCFWHLCIRKKEVTLYVNPQHDDFLNSACFESTDLSIVDNNDSEKEIDHDNLSCDDIVLLYTKNSMSFMALMKDFRETLAKMCSCSVYDWYEEAEWNDVAKVGPVSWFTKLLNGRCRAVWIDTPTTRSIVISRENDLDLNKLDKYYPIGDFRDMAFPVVLELAKRNINDAMHQYRRHFVVRFEGLESTANVKDPFMDLSPHARYRMPQHLAQLCLDLYS
ncbi:unnamed protein product [Lasius platythorax]|uniref:Uncharacterized protein n=1 Tax=Lasius platythorax TaxID=488582 RepID=A0AAV2N871_9HYME